MPHYREVKNCRICDSPRLVKYLDLGEVPLCNSLVTNDKSHPTYAPFPIQVLFCEECCLSQLSIVVNPEIMYNDYVYHSSVSKTFREHCYQMAIRLQELYKSIPHPLVVDIAANDGCLLDQFKAAGFKRLLGIDPAKNLANEHWTKFRNSIQYGELSVIPQHSYGFLNDFWSEKLALSCRDEATQGASFITATNVVAHVDDLRDFLRGVHWFLDDTGVFVVEVPYLHELIKNNQFDTIYHEHLSYFLLKPLKKIFAACGLTIIRVEKYPIHGGSIRVYADKGSHPVHESVAEMEKFEEEERLYKVDTYIKFSDRVNELRKNLLALFEILHHNGSKLMGYGASAKGISLLNYCGIPRNYLSAIVDDTPAKQGKYTPGSLIPIVNFSRFHTDEPDHILLLAWNFADELMMKTQFHKDRGGYYIIPIPEIRVI